MPTPLELVFNSTSLTEAIEGKASPRNPKEEILNKSSSLYNLEVACLWNANTASSLSIPLPLSITLILLNPDSINSILISSLLASTEFSTNSLTTDKHLSTTSPAAILLASKSLITLIFAIHTTHPFTY